MGNKIAILLVVALFLLVGCSDGMTVVKNQNQQNGQESSETEQNDISETESKSIDIPDESDISEISDFSETSDISEPSESSSPPEISEPEHSAPEISEPEVVISDDELVLISDYIPDIRTDIRYATKNNFTGEIIYDSSDAYLRYGTVKKLVKVQSELNELGYELLIWDAYRPTEAQWKLWEICPDATFVSDPNKGYSSHSRGNTVDITIVRLDGSEVEMPSGFDEFTSLADRDYGDVSELAAKNSQMLEDIMSRNGFSGYRKEWWHYSDTVKYDVVE